jgi:hypothetical protein
VRCSAAAAGFEQQCLFLDYRHLSLLLLILVQFLPFGLLFHHPRRVFVNFGRWQKVKESS